MIARGREIWIIFSLVPLWEGKYPSYTQRNIHRSVHAVESPQPYTDPYTGLYLTVPNLRAFTGLWPTLRIQHEPARAVTSSNFSLYTSRSKIRACTICGLHLHSDCSAHCGSILSPSPLNHHNNIMSKSTSSKSLISLI